MAPQRKSKAPIIPIGPEFPRPYVMAADPVINITSSDLLINTSPKYTSEAFKQRTGLSSDALSFKDIAEGAVPSTTSDLAHLNGQTNDEHQVKPTSSTPENIRIELVVCSFALHLIESSSELFSLLWELGTKARWLVVISPHKKPVIKDGWGWVKWNVDTWSVCQMNESTGEFLHDR
ncbi:hypothetical protein AX15_000061 [Amanita polypyramis BW_CC]|nr:hypothetical protein AX15_000061 [Amanita polypyramis BW_CC]